MNIDKWKETNCEPVEPSAELLRKWSSSYKNRDKPSKQIVYDLIDNFEKTGNVDDDLAVKVGAKPTARTSDKIKATSEVMESEPSPSIRSLAQQIGVSRSSAQRVLRTDLHLFHYKIQMLQASPSDSPTRRFHFANEMIIKIDEGELSVENLCFLTRHISGFLN